MKELSFMSLHKSYKYTFVSAHEKKSLLNVWNQTIEQYSDLYQFLHIAEIKEEPRYLAKWWIYNRYFLKKWYSLMWLIFIVDARFTASNRQ